MVKKDMKEVPMTLADYPGGTLFWLDINKTQIIMKVNLTIMKKNMRQYVDKVWVVSLDTGNISDLPANSKIESIHTAHSISYFLANAELPEEPY